MSARLKVALCATVAIAGLTSGFPAALAQSDQQATASSGTGLEEIVVTARRREEKAQSVPITLLSFSPETLAKKDIRDALKLTDSVPGFNGATGGSLGLTYTFLRGAPGVIFYWDDVPVNVNNQAQGFYFDMQNLQVLYGPQGTLFGLSNDAGAILFQPNHPKNDYDGYAKITLGNYGRQTVEALVNVPVVDDKLLVRAGVQYQKQDGYQHVIKQNIDLLNQNYWNVRFAATYNATDDIRNEFMLNYFDTQYLPGSYTFVAANPGPAGAFSSVPCGIPGIAGNCFPGKGASLQYVLNLAKTYINPTGLAGINVDLISLQKQQEALGRDTIAGTSVIPTAVLKQLNIVNTTSWDITDNLTLKNIAGYAEIYSYTNRSDIGGLELGLLQGPIPGGYHDQPRGPAVQYNEEIQAQGNFFDNKLKFQAGFFNQWGGQSTGAGGSTPSDTRGPFGIQFANNFGGLSVTGSTLNLQSRSDALYTQSSYDLGDYVEGLSITGGIRYNWDKFYTRGDSYSIAGGQLIQNKPLCLKPGSATPTTNGCPTSQAARFTSPSYTVQVNYQWRPATMFYFNNSLGYKTGGFNGQNLVSFQIYNPEHLNNYELGVKTDFDWGAIGLEGVKNRIDGSLYYGVYRGIEIQTTGAYLTPAGNLSLGTPYLDVGDGDLYGWDLQWTVLPFPDLELHMNAEYNRGKYKNFQGPNAAGTGQQSVPGVGFEILPEYKFDGTATYHLPFIDKAYGDVSVTGSYSWVQHSLASDVADVGFGDYLPGHHNIDVSLDWQNIWGRDGLSGQFFMTNVTNNSIVNGCLCAYRAIGEIGLQPAQPRMFGFSLKYEFQSDTVGAAPAAAYVPPPAVTPAPSVPNSYLVFFDFNKSDLTSQAESIVDQAAKNAGPAKVTRLEVTGHTDTVGSDAYNMRLSRRRAESVAAQLEKDGIPSSEIEIFAKGKRDLLVPTADGVKEPQNRRVQIVYSGGPTS
jgi:iron complex outermembrane receptor protein